MHTFTLRTYQSLYDHLQYNCDENIFLHGIAMGMKYKYDNYNWNDEKINEFYL